MREIIKLVVILSLICGISAATLQAVRIKLSPIIELQNDLNIRGPALERLFKRSPDALLRNKVILSIEEGLFPIFYTKENGKISGMAIEAVGKGGYGGDIALMIGADLKNEKFLGMEIIRHSETPGVGSKIEKESFREQWENHSVKERIELKQNGGKIEAISGATYSMIAVMNAAQQIYDIVQVHRPEIETLIEEKDKAKN